MIEEKSNSTKETEKEDKATVSIENICNSLNEISEGMLQGKISFSCDKLTMAMKCCHPAMELNGISFMIDTLTFGKTEVPYDELNEILADLKGIKKAFKIKELGKPIKDFETYLSDKKPKEKGN